MAAVPSDAVGVNDYYKQNVYDTSNNTVGEVSDLLLDKSGRVKAVAIRDIIHYSSATAPSSSSDQ